MLFGRNVSTTDTRKTSLNGFLGEIELESLESQLTGFNGELTNETKGKIRLISKQYLRDINLMAFEAKRLILLADLCEGLSRRNHKFNQTV